MDKNQAKALLHIIQAFAEGKTIQYNSEKGNPQWIDVQPNERVDFSQHPSKYRIKPETKYRPFKNVEECWKEMQKHQPFGWTKSISEKRFYFISKIDDNGCFFSNNDDVSFKTLFASDTFADGTPFGIREE